LYKTANFYENLWTKGLKTFVLISFQKWTKIVVLAFFLVDSIVFTMNRVGKPFELFKNGKHANSIGALIRHYR
jgi:hypothetical protein